MMPSTPIRLSLLTVIPAKAGIHIALAQHECGGPPARDRSIGRMVAWPCDGGGRAPVLPAIRSAIPGMPHRLENFLFSTVEDEFDSIAVDLAAKIDEQ